MTHKHRFALAHIAKYPLAFSGIIGTGFINSCVSFLLPVTIGEFFRLQFQSGSSRGKILGWLGLQYNSIDNFVILFIVLLLIKVITTYVETVSTYWQGELFVKDLREKIFTSQMNWSINSITKRTYGKYLLRYSNDMKAVQNYLTKGFLEAIVNILFILTGLVLLSRLHAMLTIIFLCLLLVATMSIYFLARYQKPFISASRSDRSSLLAFVARSLSGFERIKMRRTENVKIKDFKVRSVKLYKANMKSNKIESLLQSSTPFLIYGMIGILLWQMTMPYININAADGLMIILIILMMQGALRRMLKVPGFLNKGLISLEKIDKLLEQNKNDVSVSPVNTVS